MEKYVNLVVRGGGSNGYNLRTEYDDVTEEREDGNEEKKTHDKYCQHRFNRMSADLADGCWRGDNAG